MSEILGYRFEWTIELREEQHMSSNYLKIVAGEGITHSSEGLGEGIISLMFIVNALFDAEKGTIVVIDEPELSLHPELVRKLGKVFGEHSKERQIVLFTHSPLLVNWDYLDAGAEIARVYRRDGESFIAQPQRQTIQSISVLREGRAWKTPHVLGLHANEVFFLEDRIIVLEGQEDAVLFPRVYELLDEPMTASLYGWGAGGKNNFSRILTLLRELKFEKVAAILDSNAMDDVKSLNEDFAEYFVGNIPAPDIRTKEESHNERVEGLLDENKNIRREFEDETLRLLKNIASFMDARSKPTNGDLA